MIDSGNRARRREVIRGLISSTRPDGAYESFCAARSHWITRIPDRA